MGINNCRVTITDMDGIEHTTEVTAATLYEAVAVGIKTIKGSEWTGQVAEGFNTVKVVSQSPKVEHAVQIGTFQKWLAQPGRTPKDIIARQMVQAILDGK